MNIRLWLLLVWGACFAAAQSTTGVIVGHVADPSGGPIPHASVILTNAQTGDARSYTTDGSGDFTLTAVQPGTYTLKVSAGGFKHYEKQNLILTSSERLNAGTIALALGTQTETITVEAEVTPVQTASPERSVLLNDKHLETLMTRGRDFMGMLQILPGVVSDGEGGDSLGVSTSPTVSGVRNEYNSMSVDGVGSNTRGGNKMDTPLNVDAIGEVKVLKSNYSAEYGKSAGAIINVVTKSGTKTFRGAAYYYKRHEQFNATPFFNNTRGFDKPRYRFQTFGYNLGGPIFFPGMFNASKEKLFFFFSQEILPNKRPSGLNTFNVPTELERRGDFSQTVDPSGRMIAVRDTLNANTPFAGNVLPPGRINPAMQKVLNLFPLPNYFNRSISKGDYNLVLQDVLDRPVRQEILRIDYNISTKWRMYFRGSDMVDDQKGRTSTANNNRWLDVPVRYKTRGPSVGFNFITLVSSTSVNELTVGMSRWTEDQGFPNPSDLQKLQRDKLGITLGQLHPRNNPLNLIPEMSFGRDITSTGNNTGIDYDGRFPMGNGTVMFTISDGFTKIWNQHTFKVGINLEGAEYNQPHIAGSSSFTGNFNFGRGGGNPNDANLGYANALLGNFQTYTEGTFRPDYSPRTRIAEWYVQDNWRVHRGLTLDYGLRFTWALPQTYKRGDAAALDLDRYDPAKAPVLYRPALNPNNQRVAQNPLTGEFFPTALIGAFVPATGNPANGMALASDPKYPGTLVQPQGILYAPRIGFAYDPFGSGKTAIRGGFGVFYNSRTGAGVAGDLVLNPPFIFNPTQYFGSVDNYMEAGGVLAPGAVTTIERYAKVATIYSTSFGIQRSIGFGTVLDVAYVSTLGRHLGQYRNINKIPYGARWNSQNQDPTKPGSALPDVYFRPFPGYSNINYREYASSSNYHSLEVQANRRFRNGVQFGVAWTWSKNMGYTDGSSSVSEVAMYVPLKIWNYGKTDYDRTHNLVINYLWDIPRSSKLFGGSRPAKLVLDGWQVAGMTRFVSGTPMGISLSTSDDLTTNITGGGDGARTVLLGNPNLPKNERTFSRFFDTSMFARPTRGTIGTAPRDVIRGPGINNWNLSLFKNFRLYERKQLQFRTEMYNAFNHTQFSNLDTTARFDAAGNQINQQFGQLTSARDPRIMQFSLRLSF